MIRTVASVAGAQSANEKRDQISQNRSIAGEKQPDIQAKPDLWQEAL